jgi:carboxyl-terminal processing protease
MLDPDSPRPTDPSRSDFPTPDPVANSDPGTLVYTAPSGDHGASRRRGVTGTQLAVAVVALMAGAALFLSGYSLGRLAATTPGTPGDEQAAFVPFWDAYRAITEQYAGGEVDRKQVIEGAIRGMIDSLGDPFSSYLSSEDYKKSLQGISGQFEGIGANIAARKVGTGEQCTPLGSDCQMVVTKPIDGAPADKAGVKAGDVITEVDAVSVSGATLDDEINKVRGPKGTTVTLTIVREGGAPQQIAIVRDVVNETEVVSRSLAGGEVGYIKLNGFSDNSSAQFVSILTDDVKAGQRKFIVDLRGNPGGFVTAARKISSQFIASGPIYWQEDAKGTQVATLAETGGVATDPAIKIVVLIDKGSASASEITAGALQDTKRATLVGVTSYGKGTIQEWEPLPNDTGGFRLTIAKWLTPDKRWIHQKGLTPDVVVEVPQSTPPDQDPILDKGLEVLGASSAEVLQVAA